jgi:hypothetical protein
MHYIGSKAVTHLCCDAPTRVFRTGKAAATPRPLARAANLQQVSLIQAFTQDLFAFVFCTVAPLAGRIKTASPNASHCWQNRLHPLGPKSFSGPVLSVGVFFNVEMQEIEL